MDPNEVLLNNEDCEEIQYILNDSEFVIEPTEVTNDIISSDANQTYFINSDKQTLVLQGGDINQLFFGDDQNSTETQFVDESSEYVQFVVNEGDAIQPSQVLYVSESSLNTKQDLGYESMFIDDSQLAQTQVIELDDLISQSEDYAISNQYAILKDGKLHLQFCQAESEAPQIVTDSSSITGRNLITGETVFLGSYKDRQRDSTSEASIRKGSRSRKAKLSGLLNRTFRLGACVDGKQLVGKVVQVKTNQGSQENFSAAGNKNRPHRAKPPPKGAATFDHLTRHLKSVVENQEILRRLESTLSAIAEIEDVQDKLSEKKLFVLVEETDSSKVHYGGGDLLPPEGGSAPDTWKFVPDFLTAGGKATGTLRRMFALGKFPNVVKLRLTIAKNESRIVIESDLPDRASTVLALTDDRHVDGKSSDDAFPCLFDGCSETFDAETAMLKHCQSHLADAPSVPIRDSFRSLIYRCAICQESFPSSRDLYAHEKTHVPNKVFECDLCRTTFTRCSNLQRHLAVHHKGSGNVFRCQFCGCSYHHVSSLTRHMVQNHIKHQERNVSMKQKQLKSIHPMISKKLSSGNGGF